MTLSGFAQPRLSRFLLTLSMFDNILKSENIDIRDCPAKMEVKALPRTKFQTLTEQMFYILLCLSREKCGMDIMEEIPALTGGRVRVGPGTLYNLLEQFAEAGLIRQTRAEGRRRSYILTPAGRDALQEEYDRLCRQAEDYRRFVQKEDAP